MIIERDEDFRAESGGQADEEGGFVNTAQVGPLVLQVLVDALRDLAREFTPPYETTRCVDALLPRGRHHVGRRNLRHQEPHDETCDQDADVHHEAAQQHLAHLRRHDVAESDRHERHGGPPDTAHIKGARAVASPHEQRVARLPSTITRRIATDRLPRARDQMEDEQEERHEGEQPCAANGHVPSVAQQPRQRVRRGDAPPEAQQPDELHLAPRAQRRAAEQRDRVPRQHSQQVDRHAEDQPAHVDKAPQMSRPAPAGELLLDGPLARAKTAATLPAAGAAAPTLAEGLLEAPSLRAAIEHACLPAALS
mmetsp:Transcript_65754/g.196503  ORF Transcript_65754/g.196503 Transcript_65754/m.196503 type:complete len:309 (+) Transcript_65754:655-1581(+)